MPSEFYVRHSGSWRLVRSVSYNNAGSWLPMQFVHIRDGGVWRQVFVGWFQANITISADTQNYNLYNALVGLGWDQVLPVIATVTINNGVKVTSSSRTTPAFTTGGAFPANSSITIVNNGVIRGAGGDGGTAQPLAIINLAAGKDGGTALKALSAIVVTNNGTIAGGGGGGGGGQSKELDVGGEPVKFGGGGGGGGAGLIIGPAGLTDHGADQLGQNGQPGTETAGGLGGAGASGAGAGGAGGNSGVAGNQGFSENGSGLGNGGLAGYYAEGNNYITWNTTGTRLGRVLA